MLGNLAYPIQPYIIKNYKIHNLATIDIIWFNVSMNGGWIMINNAFDALKGMSL
jgi:hypothetical protein